MGRPYLALIVLAASAAACGGTVDDDDGPPPDPTHYCAAKQLAPWTRARLGVGGAATFNEVMYHPAGTDPEWIELYNPFAFDFDLSDFRLDGAIHFAFPADTRIAPGGYLVLASRAGVPGAAGVFTGSLPDDAGAIELWNNAGRLIDTVAYRDDAPWPVAADGSGASLAKRDPDTASERGEEWTASAQVGGTPGAANFPRADGGATTQALVASDARWRYQAGGTAPASWSTADFDDAAWPEARAPFYTSDRPPPSMNVTATFTADNYVALYAGKADGSGLRYLGRDAIGDWSSAETLPFVAAADEYLYLAAWEAPGNNGGPQMLIAQLALADGSTLSTDATTFEWTLGPAGASPGGALTDPPPAVAQVQGVIAAAAWAAPQAVADSGSAPWGGALAGAFAPTTRYVWPDTFTDQSVTNTQNTYVLFRSKRPIVPPRGATAIPRGPTTTYYRTRFDAAAGLTPVQAWIDHLVDDGAIFYLNGTELARVRMPAGAVTSSTLAAAAVDEAPPATATIDPHVLRAGANVLAVEVHQAVANDVDLFFAAGLRAQLAAAGDRPAGLVLSELGPAGDGFFVELANVSGAALDVGGEILHASSGELVLPAKTLAPGELLVLDAATLGFAATAGDPLFLYDRHRAAVLDAVRIADVPRARTLPAFAWGYPDLVSPGAANVVDVHHDVVIDEVMYHAPPVARPDGTIADSKLEWLELTNRGSEPVDLGGYQLVDAVAFELPAGTTLAAGGYLVITNDVDGFRAAYPALAGTPVLGQFGGGLADGGDRVALVDACGNLADEVRYADGGRWPAEADGGGASLELRDPRADHAAAEAWAASDEGARSQWQTISYEAIAAPSAVGPDGQWQELVLGLLDAGEVLIDDVSVVVDPATAPVELISGGDFEGGAAAATFRRIGNHRHADVVVDPSAPGNHVLRLRATGPTEHMHNHVETTLAGGHRITNGRTYRISLRARWLSGSNLLNTRLYFNRLARTTVLARPPSPGTPGARNSVAVDNLGPTYRELRHAPVVPAAGEPVEVTVVAADPDGVATMTLWYAADGAAPVSLPMTDGGGGRFAATVPARGPGSQVQFWVEGADARGAKTTFPAAGAASRALWKVEDDRAARNGLHNLRILMAPADATWLFDARNLMSNDYLPATVIVDERVVTYDAGVRLKGSERGRPTAQRIGFGVRFPADAPFRGILDGVLVDRSQGVGYGQREIYFFQAMNRAGAVPSQYDDLIQILSPRTDLDGPAHLQLARFGGEMLAAQFDHGGDGDLFEYELVYYPTTTDDGTPTGAKLPQPDSVVGTGVRDLGADEEAYRHDFIIKANRWRDDYRGLMHFVQVFGQGGAAFDGQVADVIDVDQWLRAFAIATLSGAVDNYASGAAHNAEFYLRPSDGRALYFPHDLDFLGGPQGPVVGSGDLAKLIAVPGRARAYYGHLQDIIATGFNGQYMRHWSEQLGALLPGQNFAGHLQYVIDRAAWVTSGAPNAITRAIPPVAFAITTNGGAALTVAAAAIDLDGQGWVDVDAIRREGAAMPLVVSWPAVSGWRATVPLACGAQTVRLDAVDRHGGAVGSDSIDVTRTGPGCP